MWKRYLGPFAKIIGIDINPDCRLLEEPQIKICIGDQSDTVFLQEVIDKYGVPDIILDDGSHVMKDVCTTFNFLYDKVSKNGVYFIEDLCTAYWEQYGGGLKRAGTFIELCKDLIDSLNARNNGLPRSFADSTLSMSFYESVVVFEKIEWPKDSSMAIMVPSEINYSLLENVYGGYGSVRNNWFHLRKKGIRIADYLLRGGYKRVAVYGMGSLGRILCEELLNTEVIVEYFIDKNRGVSGFSGLKGFLPEELSNAKSVGLIIITPVTELQSIENELKQHTDTKLIGLDELIDEVMNTYV